MRIGYCSPFKPLKTGIADFSEELVFALAQHVEIVIFSPVQCTDEKIKNQFEIHTLRELDCDELRNSLDLLVYHVGNNVNYHGEIVKMMRKYPGVLEVHEIGLHHLAAAMYLEAEGKESYLKMVEYCHGKRGVRIAEGFFAGQCGAPWNDHALDMCMARPVIESATAVIVHSEMVKQMVLGICPEKPIVNIMLHAAEPPAIVDSVKYKRQMKLPENAIVFGSFGFATSAKRIIPTLDAVKKFREENRKDFVYLIVGEAEKDMKLAEQIQQRGLEENVVVTGFTELEDFKNYIGACDFCINLRYPTQGETSGSLHRMLGMGKPLIVTDIGTFGDYPDEIALKVRFDEHEVEDIYQALCKMVNSQEEMQRRSFAAVEFAKIYCNLDTNAGHYADFFRSIAEHTWQPEYEDVLITRLCELGLSTEEYLEHFSQLFDGIKTAGDV